MESNKIIYVDHSATTFVKDEVLKEMLPYFKDSFGNPSSVYSIGRKNKEAIEKSRVKVSKVLGCKSNEIYFTSGGSESDNMIVSGIANKYKNKGRHIITSKIEHHAILNTCLNLEKNGFKVTYLNVDESGIVKLDELENAIREDTILISIMFANNEIGTIEPIEKIANIAHRHGIFFHTDAVQAIGHVNINVDNMGIDALSLSAHKFYGPKGVGVAYIKEDIEFENLIFGGHQEFSKRAGTENVAAIVGLGKAIEIANLNMDINREKMLSLREYFLTNLKPIYNRIRVNGDMVNRLPGNINMCIKGIDSESMLLMLDMKNICASSGSACNSSCLESSHVLKAINVPENIIKNSLRITLGEENTFEEVKYVAECICDIVLKFNKI